MASWAENKKGTQKSYTAFFLLLNMYEYYLESRIFFSTSLSKHSNKCPVAAATAPEKLLAAIKE